MWRIVFIVFIGSGVLADLPPLEELLENVNKNFKYLDGKNLDTNASFALAWGLGEVYMLEHTATRIDPNDLNEIKKLIPKFDAFIQKAIKEHPDDLEIQLFFRPQTWPAMGDFRFKKGRISEGEPLDQSLQEIYERTAPTNESEKCLQDLITTNKGSDVSRICELNCKELMRDTNFTEGIPLDERINYLSFEAMLNCSNDAPEEIMEIIANFCNHTKRQVNTMYERRYEAEFDAIKYYFLDKLLLCGTYGFPEFYDEEYISEVIGAINSDGSVGTKHNSEEEKEVLTSMVATLLTSVIRLVEESKKH